MVRAFQRQRAFPACAQRLPSPLARGGMYKLFLAWRYLTGRPLTLIAVVVLMFSFAVLVVAPSVMNGFQVEFHKRIRGTLSDLTISSARPFEMPERPEIERGLLRLPHVKAVAPYLENPALDKHLSKIDYCFMRGVDPEREAQVSELDKYLMSDRDLFLELEGFQEERDPEVKKSLQSMAAEYPEQPDLPRIYRLLREGDPTQPGLPTCLVGIYYLRAFNLRVGDTILLTTASAEGEVAQDKEFLVVGAFRTGMSEKDRRVILTGLRTLQAFVGVSGRITGYSMALDDYQQADEAKQALRVAIHEGEIDLPLERGFYVRTWEEHNENLLKAVAMEKALIRMMTFLIVIASMATIFFILFMAVYTKVREFGILRALGGTPPGVLGLFVGQGVWIALVGMGAGLALGVVFATYINEIAAWQQQYTGWHPFPPDVYYLDRIPTRIDLVENLQNFVITLVFGGMAALIPGLMAAFRPPLRALRHD